MSEGTTDSVEFFGVKLKVKDPRLAALLNSDVGDDVVVIGRRARDLMAHDVQTVPRTEPQDCDRVDHPPDDAGPSRER